MPKWSASISSVIQFDPHSSKPTCFATPSDNFKLLICLNLLLHQKLFTNLWFMHILSVECHVDNVLIHSFLRSIPKLDCVALPHLTITLHSTTYYVK